jgi:predicted double-glycine peptidase
MVGTIVAAFVLLSGAPGHAANIGIGSGTRVNVPVKSMKDLRDKDLVKQRLDYSCGAAALATILRYGFGDEVTEREILIDLFDLLSEDEKGLRRKEGFSLLDLQQVAQARGYKAQGFKLAPEYLPKLGGPVIVFIEPRGYKHFAVLRGAKGDRIYLADPSRGNVRMPAYRFLDAWIGESGKGIIFVIEPKDGLPEHDTPLSVPVDGLPQPEIMTAREMLAVGSPYLRLPELVR